MKTKKQKICAVTVTYGDRYNLVANTIQSAKKEKISHIIIIDNCSAPNSRKKLDELRSKNKKYITLIHLKENTGSAGGFKRGLQEALKIKTDFLIVLDDDNLLDKGAIKNLLNYWEILSKIKGKDKTVLFCLRYYDVDFLKKTEKELKLKKLEKDILIKNSYCYFSVQKMMSIIRNKFRNRKQNKKEYYPMVCGAYGGMFLHKSALKAAGYPDDKMFTYYDDISYTYSMYKKGYALFLIPSSKITDQETTLQNSDVKSYFSINKILTNINTMNDKKLHYGYRNRIILEKKHLIDNKTAHLFNKLLFKAVIVPTAKGIYFAKYRNVEKIKSINSAIRAGEEYVKSR